MSLYYRLIRHSGNRNLFRLPPKATSYWTELWSQFKARLAAALGSRPYSGGADNDDSGKNGPGTVRFIDPLTTTIIAPPRPATPITRLPDDQLVIRDTCPHG
ncbi:hypothetical protein SCACP_00940 [Sporomusa carbonis]|uniref:hypothetical protein n=1 Tax=Sporomusa carbonis TaxID=3076075 RepID=UPI003A5F43E0